MTMSSCPDPDVWLRIERGELPESEARRCAEHLTTCADCRERTAVAGALAAWAEPGPLPERGAECASEADLAALAGGALDPGPAGRLRAHVADCPRCLVVLQAAVEASSRVSDVLPGPGHRGRLRPLRWAPLVAAAAAVLMLALWPRETAPPSVAHLASLESLPVSTARGGAEAESFEGLFERAGAHYEAGAYAAADELFARAAALRPEDGLTALYLGSARLLSGRPADALPELERGATLERDPGTRDELLWQLAQARLAAEDAAGARLPLEELRAGAGHRAGEAARLLERLEAVLQAKPD